MSPEEQAAPITIRAGELPLQAFVSSVMNDELMQARQEVVRAIDSFGSPRRGHSNSRRQLRPVERSYLQKVRTADLVGVDQLELDDRAGSPRDRGGSPL